MTPSLLRNCARLLVLCLLISGCASGKASNLSDEEFLVLDEEQIVGNQIHNEMLARFYIYTEPKLNEYVRRIGTDLTDHAKRNLPYQFFVLYDEKIYATSAPGGYVYITTGFINFIESEAELAAVFAHEIAELQYKPEELDEKRKDIDAILQGAAMLSPLLGPFGGFAMLGVVATSMALDLQHLTPEKKLVKSDENAMDYMVAAGYDPQGYVDFINSFLYAEKKYHPYFVDYYELRPITSERYRAIMKHFSDLDLNDREFKSNYKNYQTATKGVREIYQTAM